MKPFFPFYGSKWRISTRYPPPKSSVIEPFAGSAGYSVYHEPKDVLLVDLDPIIVGLWEYLTRARSSEILALPDLDVGQSVDSLSVPQEARWLIGFWINQGSASPKKTAMGGFGQKLPWGDRVRQRIASQVDRIRTWKIRQGSYEECPQQDATWFVDPPYVVKGKYYRVNRVDYTKLGEWCKQLQGCVVVCEQAGATWLPFEPLATIQGQRRKSDEVIWTRS